MCKNSRMNSVFLFCVQECCLGRFKGIHFYNVGVFFEMIMAFVRPFLKQKYLDRVSCMLTETDCSWMNQRRNNKMLKLAARMSKCDRLMLVTFRMFGA